MTRTCRLLGVVLAASLAGPAARAQEGSPPPGGAAPPAGRPVIGPERTGWFKAAFLSPDHRPPTGWTVTGISIGERAEVRLAGPDGAEARVGLRHPSDPCAACGEARHFRVEAPGVAADVAAWVRDRLDAGAGAGDPWTAASPDRTDEGREPEAGAFETAAEAVSSVVNDVARLGENLGAADLLAVLWCVLLVLLAREVALAARGSSAVRLGLLLALAGGAFAIRAALATFGPGDLHMNLYAPSYGLGSAGLLRVLGPVLGPDPLDLVWVGTALGSLAPVLLALAMRDGRPGWVGLAAGAILAFHPLMVRFGGEANRQSYVAFLGAAALLALSRPARAALVTYATAAVLLLNTRPEAVVALPAFWLWSFVVRRERPLSLALAAHAFVAAAAVAKWLMPGAGGAGLVGSYAGFFRFDTLPFTREACVWVDPDYTPAAARWLSVAGIAYGFFRAPRLAVWAIVAATAVLVPASNWTSGGMAISSARYQTFALLPLSVLAALGVEAAWSAATRFRPVAGTVAAALAGVWLIASTPGPMARICAPRTVDLEYRFVAETLPTLPRGAIVYYVYPPARDPFDMGLRAPFYLSAMLGLGHEWREWTPDVVPEAAPNSAPAAAPDPGGRPAFFYLQASCRGDPANAARVREPCRQAFERYRGDPVAEAVLPAVEFASEKYDSAEVPVGFYRVGREQGRAGTGTGTGTGSGSGSGTGKTDGPRD